MTHVAKLTNRFITKIDQDDTDESMLVFFDARGNPMFKVRADSLYDVAGVPVDCSSIVQKRAGVS